MTKIIKAVFAVLLFVSCNKSSAIVWVEGIEVKIDTILYEQVSKTPDCDVWNVVDDIDLHGKLCCLPKGLTLNFNGGIIKNGTLVGDMTKIETNGFCFDRVRIQGTWDVPEISTEMFKNLNYNNSLKDVMALASPKVRNRIIIKEGDYQMSALKERDICIRVNGNTEMTILGTIRIEPNCFKSYFILRASGTDIEINGTGTIVGDKHTHTGTTGEWGMGIDLRRAHNVTIGGLTVKDCWGDCIYVGGKSTNVTIENCHLDHGRRQGISITSADGVTVRDCEITNVAGTVPEYAIDVEPNKKDLVDHVLIENVTVKDCKGGFKIYGRAADARVGKVTIRNCDVVADKKITIAADKCDTLIVEDCDITQHNTWGCVTCTEVGHAEIRNNTLHYDKSLMARLKDWMRPKFGKKKVKVMEIEDCGTTDIVGNKEIKL